MNFPPHPQGAGGRGQGDGSEAPNKLVYLKSTSNFDFFFHFSRGRFLMWVGGVGGSGALTLPAGPVVLNRTQSAGCTAAHAPNQVQFQAGLWPCTCPGKPFFSGLDAPPQGRGVCLHFLKLWAPLPPPWGRG